MMGQSGPISERPDIQLGDLVAAHAEIADRDQLIEDRRAFYRLALELLGAGPSGTVTDDALDDPVTRFRVSEVARGNATAGAWMLTPTGDIVGRFGHRGWPEGVRLAGGPDAARMLAGALRAVAGQAAPVVRLIDESAGEGFAKAAQAVEAGMEIARVTEPTLFADLIGHVRLIGILDPERSGDAVSASDRNFPGLILVRPDDPLSVAESVLHESAHQKFFDLAITRDILPDAAEFEVGYVPSWRTVRWPLEQTIAACHAYAALAQFDRALPDELRQRLSQHSLLPRAAERAVELGRWLLGHAVGIGVDALRLVAAILGRPLPVVPAPPIAPPATSDRRYVVSRCTVVETESRRHLVGVPLHPPRLMWLDADAAAVLRILKAPAAADPGPQRGQPEHDIHDSFRGRVTSSPDSLARVVGALDVLVRAELAAVAAPSPPRR